MRILIKLANEWINSQSKKGREYREWYWDWNKLPKQLGYIIVKGNSVQFAPEFTNAIRNEEKAIALEKEGYKVIRPKG